MKLNDYLTLGQIAKRHNIKYYLVTSRISIRQVPVLRVGKTVLVHRRDVKLIKAPGRRGFPAA